MANLVAAWKVESPAYLRRVVARVESINLPLRLLLLLPPLSRLTRKECRCELGQPAAGLLYGGRRRRRRSSRTTYTVERRVSRCVITAFLDGRLR